MTRARTIGWRFDSAVRDRLLALVPPAYPQLVADHVTLAAHVKAAPPPAASGRVVGTADDGAGVQALVVEVDGATRRPDGGVYHITWSLDPARGRTAIQSNDVIARLGWRPLAEPVTLPLRGAVID